jgi:hypothetical protein
MAAAAGDQDPETVAARHFKSGQPQIDRRTAPNRAERMSQTTTVAAI